MEEKIILELSKAQAKGIKSHYENVAETLARQIRDLQNQLTDTEELLGQLNGQTSPTRQPETTAATATGNAHKTAAVTGNDSKTVIVTEKDLFGNLVQSPLFAMPEPLKKPPVNYNPAWNNTRKAFFVLNENNRLMTLNEILQAMKNLEPNLAAASDADYRKIQANISVNLKINVTDTKKLNRIKSDDGEFMYGFIEWFDENAHPKQAYLRG